MHTRQRLRRMEIKLKALVSDEVEPDRQLLVEDWLQIFDAWSKHPKFAHHEVFQNELRQFHEEYDLVRAKKYPLLDPPEAFLPRLDLRERRLRWRARFEYPELSLPWMKTGITGLGIMRHFPGYN